MNDERTPMNAPDEKVSYGPPPGPWSTTMGSAFVSIIDPTIGHEREYNRWYEDDHYISAAMTLPWFFAGRRWVAPKSLRALRYPSDSSVIDPVDNGIYMHNYWIATDHWEDVVPWLDTMTKDLIAEGRILPHQNLIHNAFHSYVGAHYRDGDAGPRDVHALNYPYKGVVCEFIHAHTDADRPELLSWLRDEHIPEVLKGSSVAMCLTFVPMHYPEAIVSGGLLKDHPDIDRRVTLLWFLDDEPADCWDASFANLGKVTEASGKGRVEFCAPFVPVIHGTDCFVDELR
jgi:hypothetical protein